MFKIIDSDSPAPVAIPTGKGDIILVFPGYGPEGQTAITVSTPDGSAASTVVHLGNAGETILQDSVILSRGVSHSAAVPSSGTLWGAFVPSCSC